MTFDDYIKIRGYDATRAQADNPAEFEIFQGLGAELVNQQTLNSETGELPILPVTPLPEALWDGQDKLIQGESTYVTNLETLFKQQQAKMPADNTTLIGEVLEEIGSFLEELFATFLGGFVVGVTGAAETPAAGAVFVVSKFVFEILISYGFGKLMTLFQKGVDLCQGIKAENDAMLDMEASLENYNLRKDNLRVHTEMLENVINQIATMEQMLERGVQTNTDNKAIVKSLKPIQELEDISADTEHLKDIKETLETLQEDQEKLKEAIEALKYNNEIVDLGPFRVGLRNKVLDFS